MTAAMADSATEDFEQHLAPYAQRSRQSAGRRQAERLPQAVDVYREDARRIVRSAAFRRLSAKTQVFTDEMGDYHRTRLTHTLEVASVARDAARRLRLNEDLTEALALAHDLGHPPFGHAGEVVLDECLAEVGGFDHNRHGLRIVEELELMQPGVPGLNLTYEVLEGQAARVAERADPATPLLEVQVVEAADGLAYSTHDADDALKLGLLPLEELLEGPLWGEAARRVAREYTGLSPRELQACVFRELLTWQVDDLARATGERLRQAGVASVAEVRRAGVLARPSEELGQQQRALGRLLYDRVYRHPRVLAMRARAQTRLRRLFELLVAQPQQMPESFRARVAEAGLPRTVGDYVAGMTDHFVLSRAEALEGHVAGTAERGV